MFSCNIAWREYEITKNYASYRPSRLPVKEKISLCSIQERGNHGKLQNVFCNVGGREYEIKELSLLPPLHLPVKKIGQVLYASRRV
jgi:hypothetical protein